MTKLETIIEKRATADRLFGDEARSQGISEDVIEEMLSILSSGKGKNPFFIECGHHAIKPNDKKCFDSVDFNGRDISGHEGIRNSFYLGFLAQHVRNVKGRTARIVISLSNLRHTQGSNGLRKLSEENSQDGSIMSNISLGFQGAFDEAIPFPEHDICTITQSEGTSKARNKIKSLMRTYEKTNTPEEIFNNTGTILLHAELDDEIDVLLLSTQESRFSDDERIEGGIPLLTREGPDEEWSTECGPTIAGIQHAIYQKLGNNNPNGSILTIDDFSDTTIGLKSMRGITLINDFIGGQPSDKHLILTKNKGGIHLLSSKLLGVEESRFEDALQKEVDALFKQGYLRVGVYKSNLSMVNKSVLKEVVGCDTGLCSL